MRLTFTALALLLIARPLSAQERPATSLYSAPVVSDAPGRGIQKGISGHTAAVPTLYDLDTQPMEQVYPLVQRQMLIGAQSTFVKWTVKAGGVFPLHHHSNEQTTWITKGRCEVYSQGRKFVMTAGMVLIIPPNVPHEFVCTEDTIDVDFFAPARQDWIDNAIPAGPSVQ
jgi:quercetin dioxygenase-like cupin family protein